MASSTVSMHGYAVYDPALPPPTPHRAPFEDAAAPEEVPRTPSRKQRGLKKMGSRDTFTGRALVHNISRITRDRPSTRNGSDTEGIYMTVVQETDSRLELALNLKVNDASFHQTPRFVITAEGISVVDISTKHLARCVKFSEFAIMILHRSNNGFEQWTTGWEI
ncbi:hypothetical protein QCA50_016178 [Cerrena zonata]|uniref:Uncharacterized protein n=1 Tax=Cerrena zonata TaxID=2478898 RepID=A0AAW0FTK3_9APHY